MNHFTYYAPTEIVFGKDAELKTAGLIKKHGGTRVFVIYGGKSALNSGLIQKIETMLTEQGFPVKTAGGVVPNPLVKTAREMVRQAIAFHADFILAVGGGSVIDTAKAVAHGTANPDHDLWEFWNGTPLTKSLPVGAVLTISAAGSETSTSSVLTNDEVTPRIKKGVNTEFNRCKFAIMNPELTMTLPSYQIGAGAADIFMHTAERYFSPVLGNHMTDEIAEGLLRTITTYGPIAVKDPHNYEAMSEVMWCGSLSHIGITGLGSKGNTAREGDWACHQLGHALSALYDSTHGASLTAVWNAWAHYVKDANISRFASLGRNVFHINDPDDNQAADAAIEQTCAFFQSLGMPLSLTELLGHIPVEEELITMADTCSNQKTRAIGNFKILNYDDMLAIYKASK